MNEALKALRTIVDMKDEDLFDAIMMFGMAAVIYVMNCKPGIQNEVTYHETLAEKAISTAEIFVKKLGEK